MNDEDENRGSNRESESLRRDDGNDGDSHEIGDDDDDDHAAYENIPDDVDVHFEGELMMRGDLYANLLFLAPHRRHLLTLPHASVHHYQQYTALYRNDPSVTRVGTGPMYGAGGCIHPLGICLRHNTHVTEVSFSLQDLHFSSYDGVLNVTYDFENLHRFLAFLRESVHLREVSMGGLNERESQTDEAPAFTNQFVRAMADNQRNSLIKIDLSGIKHLSVHEMVRLLETTETLQTLELYGSELVPWVRSTKQSLSHAFGINRTLRSLTIRDMEQITEDFLTDDLLPQLGRHPAIQAFWLEPTKELPRRDNVRLSAPLAAAYSTFLSSTRSLCELDIRYEFTEESMTLLLQGMSQCPTLTTLDFNHCTVENDETLDLFIAYMRSTASSAHQVLRLSSGIDSHGDSFPMGETAAEIVMETAAEIVIDETPAEIVTDVTAAEIVVGETAAEIVVGETAAEIVVGETVAPSVQSSSQLRALELDNNYWNCNLSDLYDAITADSGRSMIPSLQRIRVAHVRRECVHSFLACLAHLLYVRDLNVWLFRLCSHMEPNGTNSTTDPAITRRDVVQSLRRNGSLHRVWLGGENLRPGVDNSRMTYFNEREQRLVNSFVARNKWVPLLLSNPNCDDDDDDDDDDDETEQGSNRPSVDWKVVPALLDSAQQTPRVAPNSVLIGLLALDESIVAE